VANGEYDEGLRNGRLMSESDDRFSRRDRRLRQGAAWIAAAGIYGAAPKSFS
jgi:hypothetical protein